MATGGATDERWTIEKLDGEVNWSTWKFQIKHLLLAKDLWGLVDGTEPMPTEEASAAAKADYRKRSQKAFSVLVLAITPSQLYLVTSCERPKEAWDALRNQFERDTLANKLLLKKQYFRLEMKEDTSIEQHLKHMKELTDRLAAMGAPIAEEDQVVTLLGSLPKSYSTFVTAQEARENVSLNYLQQALAHEEQKRHEQEHSKSTNVQRRDAALVGEMWCSMSKTSDMEPREPLAEILLRQWRYNQTPSYWNERNRLNHREGDDLNVLGDLLSDMELMSMLILLRTVSSITLIPPVRSSNLRQWKKH